MFGYMAEVEAHDTACLAWDALMPGWDEDEARATGEILGERDFPVYDEGADENLPTEADWEAFREATFTEYRD